MYLEEQPIWNISFVPAKTHVLMCEDFGQEWIFVSLKLNSKIKFPRDAFFMCVVRNDKNAWDIFRPLMYIMRLWCQVKYWSNLRKREGSSWINVLIQWISIFMNKVDLISRRRRGSFYIYLRSVQNTITTTRTLRNWRRKTTSKSNRSHGHTMLKGRK